MPTYHLPHSRTAPDAPARAPLQIFALGITSVFDQILDDIDATERDAIFDAYIAALDETASTYRTDAEKVSKLAEEAGGPDALTPDESGTEVRPLCFLLCCRDYRASMRSGELGCIADAQRRRGAVVFLRVWALVVQPTLLKQCGAAWRA